jgi:hypothetical protein
MKTSGKIFFAIILAALAGLNVKLAARIVRSAGERRCLSERLNVLTEKDRENRSQFVLKQDLMLKMLTDSDFVGRVIRQKEGYIKRSETVFKFGD